jgi:hypothetical protein
MMTIERARATPARGPDPRIEGPGTRRGVLTRIVAPPTSRSLGNHAIAGAIQAKLQTAESSDQFERQADWIAEHLTRHGHPDAQSWNGIGSTTANAGDVSRSAVSGTGGGGTSVRVAGVPLGTATPLASAVSRVMEPAFGLSLTSVRIHADATAAAAARSVGARAFTVGSHIAFAAGQYDPATRTGRRLLAHEITHVAQQSRGGVADIQRQPTRERAVWQRKLDELLPGRIGLIAHIARTQRLYERFSEPELIRIVDQIWAVPAASALVRQHGVSAIIGLADTRVGDRLDVAAARLLLTQFIEPRGAGPASPTSPRVFPTTAVREAFLRFHSNAELERHVRKNCIEIVRQLVPTLFSDPALSERVRRGLGRLSGPTLTMGHAGRVLTDLGVATGPVNIPFGNGNGLREPTTLAVSAWDTIIAAVGKTRGWHVFGLALFDGYHSVTVFIDNRADRPRVYWADQWSIGPGEEQAFQQEAGSVSGFRRYERTGFDGFIEAKTRQWWNEVHSPGSKCGQAHPNTWDRSCRYDATLRIWHMRTTSGGR